MHLGVKSVFGNQNWPMVAYILNHESSFNPSAVNPTSGACGVGQAYPCSKLPCPLAMSGVLCQVRWELGYFKTHYAGNIADAYYTKLTTGAY